MENRCRALLEGYDCVLRPVARRHYPDRFGYARWDYKGDGFPVMQCFWPDRAGRFPLGPPRSDPGLHGLQPDLT